MLSIVPPISAPADDFSSTWCPSYRDRIVHRLKKIAQRLSEVTFGCAHRNLGFPQNDHQVCLDCARTRLYILNAYPDCFPFKPIVIGAWRKAPAPVSAPRLAPSADYAERKAEVAAFEAWQQETELPALPAPAPGPFVLDTIHSAVDRAFLKEWPFMAAAGAQKAGR